MKGDPLRRIQMRKLIVTNIVSLDGYVDGPGGNMMALPMDASFDAYNAERLRAAGTLLLGRRTYDMFRGFWPAVAGDPAYSPVHWEISRLDNAIEKVVISDSLTAGQTAPWTGTTRIVRRADAHQQVAALKHGGGGDILVFGSRTVWNGLLTAGSATSCTSCSARLSSAAARRPSRTSRPDRCGSSIPAPGRARATC
jgi:dihydrofolate reductase